MGASMAAETRTLIVGASGQVGTQMLGLLGSKALATSRVPRHGWLTANLAELSNPAQAAQLLDPHPLDAIYCVGGMTHVDGCEDQPELAWQTNARGPGILAHYAQQRSLPFIYFSTEYVFDGALNTPGPYAEDAPTHPLSVYGKTKLEGEQRVLDAHATALVIRTTVVYGADPREKNYVYALMRNLHAATPMRVPQDQISTPTYNRDLIATTMALVAAGESGIWHVAGPELLGRLAFAQQVATLLGLDVSLLHGVSTQELQQPAPRPLYAGLGTRKLRTLHPELKLKTLAESIEDCRPSLEQFLQRKAGFYTQNHRA
jgi:dTDP-4-dehydrorhamnose reductase